MKTVLEKLIIYIYKYSHFQEKLKEVWLLNILNFNQVIIFNNYVETIRGQIFI